MPTQTRTFPQFRNREVAAKGVPFELEVALQGW